jgi:serine/threonine-protein kinase
MSPALQTGRYEILDNLGCGATCRVDKAFDTVIGRTVAVKSFLQGFGKNSDQQFLQEAQTVGRLSHTAIAQLYDVGHDASGTPFLVMEFISGRTLEQNLAHSTIPFARAAAWAGDIASALAFAHRKGVIHGDVKPGNIRVTDNGAVKLVDFGVARFSSQVSRSDRVLGTPAYLSPEQIQGQQQDARSDLFSLGIVLYEMITGVRPFGGNSLGEVCAQILTDDPVPPSQRNPELPTAFDRIIARCLAKNPDHRYKTGNDLARALYLVARTGRETSPRRKALYWLQRPLRPRDFWAVASAVLLIASILVAVHSSHDRANTSSQASASAPSRQAPDDDLAVIPASHDSGGQHDAHVPDVAKQKTVSARSRLRKASPTSFEQTP